MRVRICYVSALCCLHTRHRHSPTKWKLRHDDFCWESETRGVITKLRNVRRRLRWWWCLARKTHSRRERVNSVDDEENKASSWCSPMLFFHSCLRFLTFVLSADIIWCVIFVFHSVVVVVIVTHPFLRCQYCWGGGDMFFSHIFLFFSYTSTNNKYTTHNILC